MIAANCNQSHGIRSSLILRLYPIYSLHAMFQLMDGNQLVKWRVADITTVRDSGPVSKRVNAMIETTQYQ